MKEINKLRPFTRFCCTIGNLPTSYMESLTYEEQLLWLCDYLKNTVIPTVNNNAEAVEELQNLYIVLKNYVDNYFNNLDVQEEINNKLDEMVESGELQEIITSYLNSKAIFAYDTVNDMKQATNLINGSYAKTLGYHNKSDGGSALYKIRNITSSDNVDEKTLIRITDSLVAELIIENNTLNIKQFGAYGDDIHDDYSSFESLFKIIGQNEKTLSYESNKFIEYNIIIPKGVYKIQNSDILHQLGNARASYCKIEGNQSIIHFNLNTAGYGFNINDTLLNIIFNDIIFYSDNNNCILFNNVSSGGTQGLSFNNCTFKGTFNEVFHLTGSNNNSEYLFNNCGMSGIWNTFLYTVTSDQFLNYWFNNCRYWCSSQFIKAPKGGHFKITNCDISGYQPSTDTYLYEIGSGSGAYGVQTFIDSGSRYELKSLNAKVLKSNWDQGQIIFDNCDFSSSSAIHTAAENVFNIVYNSATPFTIIEFNKCKLLGKFYCTGNGTGAIKVKDSILYGIDSNNIETLVNIPNKTNPYSPYVLFENCYLQNGIPFTSKYKMNSTGGILQTAKTTLNITSNYDVIDNNTKLNIVRPTIITETSILPSYASNGYLKKVIVKSLVGTVASSSSNRNFNLTTDIIRGIKKGMKIQINGTVATISDLLLANKAITIDTDITMNSGDDVYLVLNSAECYMNRNNQNIINNEVYLVNSDIICEIITEDTYKAFNGNLIVTITN